MFTYSHTNTPLGQSERAYYLSYYIYMWIKNDELPTKDATCEEGSRDKLVFSKISSITWFRFPLLQQSGRKLLKVDRLFSISVSKASGVM